MSIKTRFSDYAQDFEATLRDDDWGRLEAYFTENATYNGGLETVQGREAVLRYLKHSVDTTDRRMDSRQLDFEPLDVDGNTVSGRWTVTYKKAGCPDLVVSGCEVAVFDGNRIAELRDEYAPGAIDAFREWLSSYGAQLRD